MEIEYYDKEDVEISIPIRYFPDSPDLTIICRLLNT
jgi:hypothetical protein